MPDYEYKTVALPRSINQRRKRRQTEADMVAELLGKTLNDEARERWEYVRAETLTTPGSGGLMKKSEPAAFVVLIFRREREVAPAARQTAPSGATVEETHTEPRVRYSTIDVDQIAGRGSVMSLRPSPGTARD